jgi:hypothetical protein
MAPATTVRPKGVGLDGRDRRSPRLPDEIQHGQGDDHAVGVVRPGPVLDDEPVDDLVIGRGQQHTVEQHGEPGRADQADGSAPDVIFKFEI